MGRVGAPGIPGTSCVTTDYLTGILLVKHSQSDIIPKCEPGHTELWHGYSLVYIDGNEKAHNQDLGYAGSCVKNSVPCRSCFATCMILVIMPVETIAAIGYQLGSQF